jgi:hypothetical protein
LTARQAAYPAVTLTTFRDVPWNAPFYAPGVFNAERAKAAGGTGGEKGLETAHGLPPETRCAMRLTL